jgi:hypothetical protein
VSYCSLHVIYFVYEGQLKTMFRSLHLLHNIDNTYNARQRTPRRNNHRHNLAAVGGIRSMASAQPRHPVEYRLDAGREPELSIEHVDLARPF